MRLCSACSRSCAALTDRLAPLVRSILLLVSPKSLRVACYRCARRRPYSLLRPDRQFEGIDIDLAVELVQSLDVRAEFNQDFLGQVDFESRNEAVYNPDGCRPPQPKDGDLRVGESISSVAAWMPASC